MRAGAAVVQSQYTLQRSADRLPRENGVNLDTPPSCHRHLATSYSAPFSARFTKKQVLKVTGNQGSRAEMPSAPAMREPAGSFLASTARGRNMQVQIQNIMTVGKYI